MRRHLELSAATAAVAVAIFGAAILAAHSSAFAADTPQPEKRLHTIPEDGSLDDIPVAPRVVRELTSLRPKEDLIICIAGCPPGRDRVIYAQPMEESVNGKSVTNLVPSKPDKPVEPEMKSPVVAPAVAPVEIPDDQPSAAAEPKNHDEQIEKAVGAVEPDVINGKPLQAETAGKPSFEPTVAMPKGAVIDEAPVEAMPSNDEPAPLPADAPVDQ